VLREARFSVGALAMGDLERSLSAKYEEERIERRRVHDVMV
jgi:hypothetical protein